MTTLLNTRMKRDTVFVMLLQLYFCLCVFFNSFHHHDLFMNFDPLPDAIEYAVVASNLKAGDGPFLKINDSQLPSRYPLGYPLLLVPFLSLYGTGPQGFYWASMTLGSLSIFLFFIIARRVLQGEWLPRWVTFLLASSPLVWVYSSLTTTEIASMVLLLLAFFALLKIRQTDLVRYYLLLGASLGYAAFVRLPNIVVLLPVLWYLFFLYESPIRISRLLALALPFITFVAVIAAQNVLLYGGVLQTGYVLHHLTVDFSWEAFQVNSYRYLGSIFMGLNGSSIWLNGSPYPVILPLLAWTGAVVLLRQREFAVVLVAFGMFFLFFLLYASWWYYDDRFFLPLFPLVFLGAGFAVEQLFSIAEKRSSVMIASVVSLSFVLQPTMEGMSPWSSVAKGITAEHTPSNYVHVQEINGWMEKHGAGRKSTVLMTSMNLVYQDFFSNQRYTVLPVSSTQDYANLLGVQSPTDSCRELLDAGHDVYLSDYISTDGSRHREAIGHLKSTFHAEQVMEYLYGNARLYKLSLLNTPSFQGGGHSTSSHNP